MLPVVLALLTAVPGVKPIEAAELRGHIRYLASDLLEGRGPATNGLDLSLDTQGEVHATA